MKSLYAVASSVKKSITGQTTHAVLENYYKRFEEFSFVDGECKTKPQFEASITRLYHTIEKGLSYKEYRAGFGKDNIEMLMRSVEQYAEKGLDIKKEFYQTALACLHEYVRKNKEHGVENPDLEARICKLPGESNSCGGTISVSVPDCPESLTYKELVMSRHSIRHFSDISLEIETVAESVINSLYYYGIGSVPLSAALTAGQEKNVRECVGIDDPEVLIMFIGIGNYPDGEFLTTRSERKTAEIEVI